eukprot:scaffold10556_cov258-Chaetoceros_neogracile.AAC.43
MGAVALTSASCILTGRHYSRLSSQKTIHSASRFFNSCAQSKHRIYSRRKIPSLYQNRLLSSETPTASTSSNSVKSAAAKSPPDAKRTTSSFSGEFVAWYEHHLQARPIPTKAVTGCILWGIGDIVGQVVPFIMKKEEGTETTVVSLEKNYFECDYPRTARAMFFGFAIHAPLSHVHFNLLEWMTVKGGFTGLSIPVFKTIMGQFVYWSWISNSLYHGAMGAMQGKSFQQIYDRIADVIWDTQKRQWVFWIPVQLLIRHQLNVVLLTSVVWTALLSAWYPPEEEVAETIVMEEKKD